MDHDEMKKIINTFETTESVIELIALIVDRNENGRWTRYDVQKIVGGECGTLKDLINYDISMMKNKVDLLEHIRDRAIKLGLEIDKGDSNT